MKENEFAKMPSNIWDTYAQIQWHVYSSYILNGNIGYQLGLFGSDNCQEM